MKFLGDKDIYIGQSMNIEKRFQSHLHKLYEVKHTLKLQKAYENLKGIPELFVLAISTPSDLDKLEAYYITKFNSVETGLNSQNAVSLLASKTQNVKGLDSLALKYPNILLTNRWLFTPEIYARSEIITIESPEDIHYNDKYSDVTIKKTTLVVNGSTTHYHNNKKQRYKNYTVPKTVISSIYTD